MYGTSKTIELKENNNFQPGINQNVTINVEFRSPRKDGTGDPVICIDILGKIGDKFTVTEWQQADEDKIENQLKRLSRWVKEVTGENTLGNQFASYEDLAKQFADKVNGKGTLLEFKLVYNDKGYLEMPKYDGCVRSMSNPTRLVLSGSEKNKLVKETPIPTEDAMFAASTDASDDLPF